MQCAKYLYSCTWCISWWIPDTYMQVKVMSTGFSWPVNFDPVACGKLIQRYWSNILFLSYWSYVSKLALMFFFTRELGIRSMSDTSSSVLVRGLTPLYATVLCLPFYNFNFPMYYNDGSSLLLCTDWHPEIPAVMEVRRT